MIRLGRGATPVYFDDLQLFIKGSTNPHVITGQGVALEGFFVIALRAIFAKCVFLFLYEFKLNYSPENLEKAQLENIYPNLVKQILLGSSSTVSGSCYLI
ncbi:hypothetical protein ACJX0J_012465 [Zea mays]